MHSLQCAALIDSMIRRQPLGHRQLVRMQIMVTEFGDETFIVAALMAMRYSKVLVYAGALSALVVMTIISTALGMLVPTLAGKRTTGLLAGCLYTFFGARLLWIAYTLGPSDQAVEVRPLHSAGAAT
jgi:putative Ca2+/H+ antiporter (TMEM165/GDT1 family)